MKNTSLLFLSLILLCVLTNCNKPTLVGEEIFPEVDGIETFFSDTLTINASTVPEDSVRTDEMGIYLFGGIESETFGNSYADFYTQLRIPSNNLDFGANSIADSIVLYLDYAGSYGDTVITQSMEVHEMSEDISIAENYYSNKIPPYNSEVPALGSLVNYEHELTDSITIGETKVTPRFRIPLDVSLAQRFINAEDSVFANNDNFLDHFPGLYIKYDKDNSKNDAMVYFNLTSSISSLVMYYRTVNDSTNLVEDTLTQTFIINANAESVSSYDVNFENATIGSQFDVENAEELYIHALGGTNVKLDFPHLKSLGDVIINQAKISFTRLEETNDDEQFGAPSSLGLFYRDLEDSTAFNLIVVAETINSSFAALENYTTEDGTTLERYEFNCTSLLNEIINGSFENSEIFIAPAQRGASALRRNAPFRTRIAGATHPIYPTKLNLIYSVID